MLLLKPTICSKKLILLAIFLLGGIQLARAQFQYQNKPALQVIKDIEQQTSYRFLYRDALLADLTFSFSAVRNTLFDKLRAALQFHRLDFKVDSSRKQAVIFWREKAKPFLKKVTVRGQVVDASTGERLPFANISWRQDDTAKGVSANQSGSFRFSRSFARPSVTLRSTYIGYTGETVTLHLADTGKILELTFRLQPKRIDGSELIITGTGSYSDVNRQAATLVDIGNFSPLGETNSLRALQTLPSVSASPAMSDGLHVRGSPTDGFQLLLDEVPIYNQTHLFGLLDSFNSDILQRNNLFYDIAPARFQAPPGGILSLDTGAGSLDAFSGTAGLSNSSVRLTLGGPIQKGSSSWVVSGRTSYMNTVDWLNNADLVAWGLDVGREKGILDDDLVNFESQLVHPGETDAFFYDLHGKVYVEQDNGNRLIVSGYLGGDNTRQTGQRLFESFSASDQQNFDRRRVSTGNDWHNGASSMQYQQWLSDDLYAKSTLGGSFYRTAFDKDDFSYTEIISGTQSLRNFIYPFENKSVLNELKADQMLELYADPLVLTGGFSYHYYKGEYFEDSFDRPGYFNTQEAYQLDAHVQLNYSSPDMLDIFGGSRVHYYSNGRYLRWSPRVKLKLFPDAKLSAGAGFSRNHQFLNQVNLNNTLTANVWVLAGENQPPTSVNYYSGGLYLDLSDYFYTQAEGYIKEFKHLRLHELSTYSLANSFGPNPWLTDNSGTARGIEFLLRNKFSILDLSQTFTLSEMTLSNPSINDGTSFYADWDRRYQYSAVLAIKPIEDLSIYLSWMYATGTPNKLAIFGARNNERLGDYRRTDLSAEYRRTINGNILNFSVTLFNLLDRQNPWYRELSYVIDGSIEPNKFKSIPVDVYDIGLQPSFNISVTF